MAVPGELEQAVMDVLWSRSEWLSVREVHSLLSTERELAYTTVMTVLDRLAKKGLATRKLDGRAWLYQPANSRTDALLSTVLDELSKLDPPDRLEVLAALNAAFS